MFNNISYLAHRLSYEFHNGPIPHDLDICHTCDNPPCVNPKHLWSGQPADNAKDMWSKGRGVKPPEHKGEQQHKAKLTTEDVRLIRAAYDAAPMVGNRKQFGCLKQFEKKYNMSKRQIQQVAYRHNWKDVK